MLPVDSLYELLMSAPTQEDCIKHLEGIIWNNVPVSPFDKNSKVYTYKNGKYRCKETGKYFNVLNGTMFENTKIKLSAWFMAIYTISTNPKGMTSVYLSKCIKVTQKTAWFMLQRIRACYLVENDNELSGTIEMDESLVGGIDQNRHVSKRSAKTGESNYGKSWVFGMVQRGGKINAWAVKNREAKNIVPIIKRFVKKGSHIISDKHGAYGTLHRDYLHTAINHDAYEYVSKTNKSHHNNTIESAWKIMKDSVHRTYNHVSDKHIQKYLDEFVYRYNTRNLIEADKFNWILFNSGVRTRYVDLIAA